MSEACSIEGFSEACKQHVDALLDLDLLFQTSAQIDCSETLVFSECLQEILVLATPFLRSLHEVRDVAQLGHSIMQCFSMFASYALLFHWGTEAIALIPDPEAKKQCSKAFMELFAHVSYVRNTLSSLIATSSVSELSEATRALNLVEALDEVMKPSTTFKDEAQFIKAFETVHFSRTPLIKKGFLLELNLTRDLPIHCIRNRKWYLFQNLMVQVKVSLLGAHIVRIVDLSTFEIRSKTEMGLRNAIEFSNMTEKGDVFILVAASKREFDTWIKEIIEHRTKLIEQLHFRRSRVAAWKDDKLLRSLEKADLKTSEVFTSSGRQVICSGIMETFKRNSKAKKKFMYHLLDDCLIQSSQGKRAEFQLRKIYNLEQFVAGLDNSDPLVIVMNFRDECVCIQTDQEGTRDLWLHNLTQVALSYSEVLGHERKSAISAFLQCQMSIVRSVDNVLEAFVKPLLLYEEVLAVHHPNLFESLEIWIQFARGHDDLLKKLISEHQRSEEENFFSTNFGSILTKYTGLFGIYAIFAKVFNAAWVDLKSCRIVDVLCCVETTSRRFQVTRSCLNQTLEAIVFNTLLQYVKYLDNLENDPESAKAQVFLKTLKNHIDKIQSSQSDKVKIENAIKSFSKRSMTKLKETTTVMQNAVIEINKSGDILADRELRLHTKNLNIIAYGDIQVRLLGSCKLSDCSIEDVSDSISLINGVYLRIDDRSLLLRRKRVFKLMFFSKRKKISWLSALRVHSTVSQESPIKFKSLSEIQDVLIEKAELLMSDDDAKRELYQLESVELVAGDFISKSVLMAICSDCIIFLETIGSSLKLYLAVLLFELEKEEHDEVGHEKHAAIVSCGERFGLIFKNAERKKKVLSLLSSKIPDAPTPSRILLDHQIVALLPSMHKDKFVMEYSVDEKGNKRVCVKPSSRPMPLLRKLTSELMSSAQPAPLSSSLDEQARENVLKMLADFEAGIQNLEAKSTEIDEDDDEEEEQEGKEDPHPHRSYVRPLGLTQ